MHGYICYLKGKKENIFLINILSNIFKCEGRLIGDLLSFEDFEIKFENRLLDDNSEFNTELNVYVNNHKSRLFINNFSFGSELSKLLNEEILVSTQNDNPYEWILIKNNFFYIAEEIDDDYVGITLEKNENLKISYDAALMIST